MAFPAHRLDLGTVAPGPRGFPSPVDSSTLRCSLQPSCPSRLLQRHLPVCAVLSGSPSRALYRSTGCFPASPSRLPLLGLSKDAPPPSKLCESSPSLPAPERTCRLRPNAAKRQTPSVLVVLPDSDGLLLTEPCRSIAPCYRPWGSSRFAPRLPPVALQLPAVLAAFPDSPFTPSRAFPSSTAALRLRSRCLLAVSLVPSAFRMPTTEVMCRFQPLARGAFSANRVATIDLVRSTQAPTSRLCSMSESVADRSVAAAARPMLSWALFPFRVLPSTAVSLFVDTPPRHQLV